MATSLQSQHQPAQARSAQTVAAIVEGAARTLETRGFEGLTTNAVAARAGVSIGSLYQYFPGLEAIVRALIERETGLLLAAIEAIPPEQSGPDALRAVITAAVAQQLGRPGLPPVAAPVEAAGDILAMIRGMVDAAGETVAGDALTARVGHAVFGYLDRSAGALAA